MSVCLLAKRLYQHVLSDFDVHVNFRISKYGKYSNFIIAMNVVLLAVCSPIFRVCSLLSSCLELWVARLEEQRMRAKAIKLCVCVREREKEIYVISSIRLQEKDKIQSCKSNKKTNEKFYNYINKQETKGSNNCVGEYKNICEIEKMFVVVLIGTS